MDAKLVVVGGNANKAEVRLKLPMTIGRNREAGLTVSHPNVSRIHCQLYEVDGALVVRDNNSTNGTLINNDRIREAILKPGDKLTVGPLTFVAIYKHSGDYPPIGDRTRPAPSMPVPDDPTEVDSPKTVEHNHSDLADLIGGGSGIDLDDAPVEVNVGEFSFTVALDQAGELSAGSPVYVMGEKKGMVTDLKWVEEGETPRAHAQLEVAEHIGSMLREDLHVEVIKENGEVYLDIISLGITGAPVTAGQLIRSGVDDDVDLGEEPLDEAGSSLMKIHKSFDEFSENVPGSDQLDGIADDLLSDEDFGKQGDLPEDELVGSEEEGWSPSEADDQEATQHVADVNDWLKEFADLADDDEKEKDSSWDE